MGSGMGSLGQLGEGKIERIVLGELIDDGLARQSADVLLNRFPVVAIVQRERSWIIPECIDQPEDVAPGLQPSAALELGDGLLDFFQLQSGLGR